MASILEIDPQGAGLDAAASVMGRLSAPSRMPMSLGSILGQAGGAYQDARSKAAFQQEHLAQTRMQREAQAADLQERAKSRQEALLEQQKAARAKGEFNSILGKMQESGEQIDEISILGAGIKSGAFGPKETTEFMGKVMEKKNAREQKMEELRLKLADQKIAREERESFNREMLEARNQQQKDMARLAAAMRPQAQAPILQTDQGIFERGPNGLVQLKAPDGTPLKPKSSTGDRLNESEARGTLFMRQMSSAEVAAKEIVGENFDLSKLGNQVSTRMAGSDWTNWAANPQAQKYAQAAEQWAEAYLRLKTGAATNQDEIKRNARAYFPQPGDSSQVISQKAVMRKKAIEDVSIVAGRGATREPVGSSEKAPWER